MSDRNIIPSFLRIRCWSRNGRIAGRLRTAGGHGWTSENQRCGSVPHPGDQLCFSWRFPTVSSKSRPRHLYLSRQFGRPVPGTPSLKLRGLRWSVPSSTITQTSPVY